MIDTIHSHGKAGWLAGGYSSLLLLSWSRTARRGRRFAMGGDIGVAAAAAAPPLTPPPPAVLLPLVVINVRAACARAV